MPEQWVYPAQDERRQDLPGFIRAMNVAMARLSQLFRFLVRGPSVTGGTTNRVTKWTGANTLGDSSVTDTGSLVSTTNPLAAGGSNPAASGGLRLPNNTLLNARNAANSGDITMIHLSSGDIVTLRGSWGINGSSTLYPTADNVQDLGSSGFRIQDVWIGRNIDIDGALDHDGTTVGFYGVTPVTRPAALTQTYSTADRTLSAYTADVESSAYTGVDNLQVGSVYALVADLNALRVAYENLRAFTEDLAQHHNALVDDMQANGLTQ